MDYSTKLLNGRIYAEYDQGDMYDFTVDELTECIDIAYQREAELMYVLSTEDATIGGMIAKLVELQASNSYLDYELLDVRKHTYRNN